MNLILQMFKLDWEKAKELEIKLPTSSGSLKTQEISRKTFTFALLTTPKPLTVLITTNCGKLWKRWEYQTTWPASWEIYAGQEAIVRTGHGKTDWFQIRKGVCQCWILSPCLFNLYQSTSCEMPGWKKHKLESQVPVEVSKTIDMHMIPHKEL